jgi:putative transposase
MLSVMESQLKEKTKLRGHYHSVYNLQYHLVLVTKYRKKCLKKEQQDELKIIFQELITKWDCELVEFGAEEDHVHLLISCHPAMDMSKFINNLKTVSSRLLRKKFITHMKKYFWVPKLWTRAYCLLTTGGATIEVVRKYIENQGNHE